MPSPFLLGVQNDLFSCSSQGDVVLVCRAAVLTLHCMY